MEADPRVAIKLEGIKAEITLCQTTVGSLAPTVDPTKKGSHRSERPLLMLVAKETGLHLFL